MAETNKLKIFNDPIYGFIGTPNELIFNLIAHPYFQRLRRISQMGMSYVVYPGAHHTRFHHALGCMHLMRKVIGVLRFKGVSISETEETGLLCAILLHDIGHGPFSHALEHVLVPDKGHEEISLLFMQRLNTEFNGALDMALRIFKKEHPKNFMNQLVSSQLDMDRLDYLKRDSFYTGVSEGNINSERLLTMLNVKDNELVVEEKGIYSVEKFLMARRFMYWQVYLHKTGLVAEQLLVKVIRRARQLLVAGRLQNCPVVLKGFLQESENPFSLEAFAELDDIDVLSALKAWKKEPDFVISTLSEMLLNRRLLKIKIKDRPIDTAKLEERKAFLKQTHQLDDQEVAFFVFGGELRNRAYNDAEENINILTKKGKLVDVAKASDHFNLKALSKEVVKYYACYPKNGV
ncbi:MAG: HD domain-containing protein [Flavobacteriaceae bacterium]|nr:HD domain-containing protein [Flavobacteriaceae bacterium]